MPALNLPLGCLTFDPGSGAFEDSAGNLWSAHPIFRELEMLQPGYRRVELGVRHYETMLYRVARVA